MDSFEMFSKFYDKSFRKELIENPNSIKEFLDYELYNNKVLDSDKTTFVVKVSNKDTTYITIPLAAGSLSDDIQNVQAAGTAGTGGTAGSASTLGCVFSTVSSSTSASCVGTIGSAS